MGKIIKKGLVYFIMAVIGAMVGLFLERMVLDTEPGINAAGAGIVIALILATGGNIFSSKYFAKQTEIKFLLMDSKNEQAHAELRKDNKEINKTLEVISKPLNMRVEMENNVRSATKGVVDRKLSVYLEKIGTEVKEMFLEMQDDPDTLDIKTVEDKIGQRFTVILEFGREVLPYADEYFDQILDSRKEDFRCFSKVLIRKINDPYNNTKNKFKTCAVGFLQDILAQATKDYIELKEKKLKEK